MIRGLLLTHIVEFGNMWHAWAIEDTISECVISRYEQGEKGGADRIKDEVCKVFGVDRAEHDPFNTNNC